MKFTDYLRTKYLLEGPQKETETFSGWLEELYPEHL